MPAAIAAITPGAAALIGGGASILGGLVSSRGIKKASQTQANAEAAASALTLQSERESRAYQERMDAQSRADREPWRQAGVNALGQMTQRMAPGGDLMRNFGAEDFQADPGYQFRLAEGMRGMTNTAAARGGLLSGAALKAAGSYNQGMASQEFGAARSRYNENRDGQFNKLASLSGVGQTISSQNGQNAMQLGQNVGAGMINAGQQMGNNLIGAGNARASGYMAQGNVLSGMLNQGVSAWNQYQANKPPNMGGIPGAQNITPGSWG